MTGAILGMGNPLLDISCRVDQSVLDKYELKNGDQILAEEKHMPLYKELANMTDVQYIAGGATQNTVRVAQWMMQTPNATSYMGCVGKDMYADKMREVATNGGVNVQYMVDESADTGTCAVCICDDDRSLVANLAAANNYKVDHLKKPENFKLLEDAKVVYSAGFFITACSDAIFECAEHCLAQNKVYALNISAPFICEVPPFKEALTKALSMADYLFGNETEAAAFAKSEGWDTSDVAEIAKKISQREGKKTLTVVITQGKEPTVVAKGGEVSTYEVPPVDPSQIIDTNGAGDAFVGGFLAALLKGCDTAACCKAGCFAAGTIIKTSGTALPVACSYSW